MKCNQVFIQVFGQVGIARGLQASRAWNAGQIIKKLEYPHWNNTRTPHRGIVLWWITGNIISTHKRCREQASPTYRSLSDSWVRLSYIVPPQVVPRIGPLSWSAGRFWPWVFAPTWQRAGDLTIKRPPGSNSPKHRLGETPVVTWGSDPKRRTFEHSAEH